MAFLIVVAPAGNDQLLASPKACNTLCAALHWTCVGNYNCDTPICLRRAHHYGQLVEAVKHFEETAMPGIELCLEQPNQALQTTTVGFGACMWWGFALDMNRPAPLRVAQEKAKSTWCDGDQMWDKWEKTFAMPLRGRGETTEGLVLSVELFSWVARLAHALVGGADEVPVDEIAASLPSWDEHLEIVNVR